MPGILTDDRGGFKGEIIPGLNEDPSGRDALRTLVLTLGAAALLAGVLGVALAQDVAWVRFFDNLHWTAGTVTAAALAWLAVRAAEADRVQGLRWIAIALTSYALGQLIWDVQVVVGYEGFPSPSDLFYVWLGPGVAAGLLIESLRRADRLQRRTLLLDVAMLAIAATNLVLALYLPRRGDLPALQLAVMVAYPASLLTAASVGLMAMPTLHLKPSWSYGLFLLALLVTGACWMAWNAMTLAGADLDGAWFNGLFSASVLALGWAMLHWRVEVITDPAWERRYEGLLRMLPLLAVVLSFLAVIGADPHEGGSEAVRDAVYAGALVVIVLAMWRQGTLLREHDLLKVVTRELEQSEQQKRLILDTLPDLVWLKDRDGVYRMCNPALARFFSGLRAGHARQDRSPLRR